MHHDRDDDRGQTPPAQGNGGGFFSGYYNWAVVNRGVERFAVLYGQKLLQQITFNPRPIAYGERLALEHLGIGGARGAVSCEPAIGSRALTIGAWKLYVVIEETDSYERYEQEIFLQVVKAQPQFSIFSIADFDCGADVDVPALILNSVHRNGDGQINFDIDLKTIGKPGVYTIGISLSEGTHYLGCAAKPLTFKINRTSLDDELDAAVAAISVAKKWLPQGQWDDLLEFVNALFRVRVKNPGEATSQLKIALEMLRLRSLDARNQARSQLEQAKAWARQAMGFPQTDGFEEFSVEFTGKKTTSVALIENALAALNSPTFCGADLITIDNACSAAKSFLELAILQDGAYQEFKRAVVNIDGCLTRVVVLIGDSKEIAESYPGYGADCVQKCIRLLERYEKLVERRKLLRIRKDCQILLHDILQCERDSQERHDLCLGIPILIKKISEAKLVVVEHLQILEKCNQQIFASRNKSGFAGLYVAYNKYREAGLLKPGRSDWETDWPGVRKTTSEMIEWLGKNTDCNLTEQERAELQKAAQADREKFEKEKIEEEVATSKRKAEAATKARESEAMAREYAGYKFNDPRTWTVREIDEGGAPMHELLLSEADRARLRSVQKGEIGDEGDFKPVAGKVYHLHMVSGGGGGIAFGYVHVGGNRVVPTIFDWATRRTGKSGNDYVWVKAGITSSGPPSRPKFLIADLGH